MKKGFLITAAILLTGCGGGGGSSDSASTSKSAELESSALAISAEHAGFYQGTYLNSANEQGDTVLFVTTDGQSFYFSDETEVAGGTAIKTETGFDTRGSYYAQDAGALWDTTFTSSLTYNMGTASGPYSFTSGDTGTFSLVQDSDILNRSINLTILDGSWTGKHGDNPETMAINNGVLSHKSTNDCRVDISFTQIDSLNQFQVSGSASECEESIADGVYTGIAFLSDENGENNTINLIMLKSNKEYVMFDELTRN